MRKPMVTRNFKITRANVLFLDPRSGNTYQQEVVIPRTYQSTEKMLKAVKKAYDDESTKALHIMSSATDEMLYGMSEQDFINGATLLDPVTRKPIPASKPVFVDEGDENEE